MRAFVALDLPDEVREALADLSERLGVGRPVAEENLHLTLAFLDDQPEPVLAGLHDALSALEIAPFDLTLKGLDMFGGRRPHILFARVDGGAALKALHDKVHRAARAAGIDLHRERFRPHVTLTRFARDLGAKEQERLTRFMAAEGDYSLRPFRAESFALYRSILTPDGPVYDLLADYPLGASD